jgi:hypothetical protein
MVSSRGRTPLEACPPTGGVLPPHPRCARTSSAAIFGLLVASACVVGCESAGADQVSQPIVLGMSDSVAPIYNTQQLTLYEVQVPVSLPVRQPTSQEESSLGGADPPYPHQPYLLDTDESLEIRFTISNLDSEQHAVYLLLDPWNEFVRYRPGVTFLNDEETLPNPSGFQKAFLVDAMSRVEGTVTTDDTTALAIALATAMAILSQPADPNATYSNTTLVDHAFDLQNRPISNDPLVSSYIPSTIAGLTGFDLGLQTDAAENVSIEIIYDIVDLNGNRLIPQGQSGTQIGIPTTILSPEMTMGTGSGTGAGS